MQQPKCPDCQKTLPDAGQDCPDCSKTKPDEGSKSNDDTPETSPHSSEKQSLARKLKSRPLLIVVVVIVLILLSGAAFYFFQTSDGQRQSAHPDGDTIDNNTNEDEQETPNQQPAEDTEDKVSSLEELLSTHYSCQEKAPGQQIAGFQNFKRCVRERDDDIILVLEIYHFEDPDQEIKLLSAARWCQTEFGNKLLITKGDQFVILVVASLNPETANNDNSRENIFTLEYIQGLNKATESEYKYIKDKDLEVELLNACTELSLLPVSTHKTAKQNNQELML